MGVKRKNKPGGRLSGDLTIRWCFQSWTGGRKGSSWVAGAIHVASAGLLQSGRG